MMSLPILPVFIFLGTKRFFPKAFTVVIVPPLAALVFFLLSLSKIYASVIETLFSIIPQSECYYIICSQS